MRTRRAIKKQKRKNAHSVKKRRVHRRGNVIRKVKQMALAGRIGGVPFRKVSEFLEPQGQASLASSSRLDKAAYEYTGLYGGMTVVRNYKEALKGTNDFIIDELHLTDKEEYPIVVYEGLDIIDFLMNKDRVKIPKWAKNVIFNKESFYGTYEDGSSTGEYFDENIPLSVDDIPQGVRGVFVRGRNPLDDSLLEMWKEQIGLEINFF